MIKCKRIIVETLDRKVFDIIGDVEFEFINEHKYLHIERKTPIDQYTTSFMRYRFKTINIRRFNYYKTQEEIDEDNDSCRS